MPESAQSVVLSISVGARLATRKVHLHLETYRWPLHVCYSLARTTSGMQYTMRAPCVILKTCPRWSWLDLACETAGCQVLARGVHALYMHLA